MITHHEIAPGPTPRFCPNCTRSMKVPGHYVQGTRHTEFRSRLWIACPFDYGGTCRHEMWATDHNLEMRCTLCGANESRLRAERVWELERALGYEPLPFLGHDPADKLPIDEAFDERGFWKNPNPSREEQVRQMEAEVFG